MTPGTLLRDWNEVGYLVRHGLVSESLCQELIDASLRLAAVPAGDVVLRLEDEGPHGAQTANCVSKIFRLHRSEPSFRKLCALPELLGLLVDLVGPDVDAFLSQAVFKYPGALGQPLHQDATIFPFDPPRPVVGVWIPLTPPVLDSSQLEVQPRSHLLEALPHVSDEADRNGGRYLRVASDVPSHTTPLALGVGDAVVFDSHLLHASTDNRSNSLRVAAVLHFAQAGTVDNTAGVFGGNPYNDWMPVVRDSTAVTCG